MATKINEPSGLKSKTTKSKGKPGSAESNVTDLLEQQVVALSMILDDVRLKLDEIMHMHQDQEDRLELVEHAELVNCSILKTQLVTPEQYERIWNGIMGVEGTIQ